MHTARVVTRTSTKVRSRGQSWRERRTLPLYVMLVPAIIGLILFNYIPMAGIVIAFQNYKPLLGITKSAYVGLDNFARVLTLPSTWPIVRNTLFIALGKIILGQLTAIVLALLLNEVLNLWFKRFTQTLTYLLHFLSWVIFGGLLLDILTRQGMVNRFLGIFGIPPIAFLTDAQMFPWTVIVTHIWKELGWSAIIYLAALTSISPHLYEAAAVDGANRWQRIWNITIPGISGTIILLACLSLGNVLNAGFEQLLILQNAQVLSTGEIIDTFVYKMGLINYQYSLATAVGLLKGIVSLVLISLSYYLADRVANYRIF